ncbi:PREDICTED: proton-coupled amino acid transporter-like protein CG1139 [Cyphomyrmex costatus]|uniref:proton-coupled amino acid transporter-like protein CG1139 n=1 Tax=Cyphomyrmex costatus TaxID=456900 RepID=UPI0008522C5A|nr:PREDICTED: proton-coupled amino acid transporter-like protein CG1139 [Cyphomyrmex costatus]
MSHDNLGFTSSSDALQDLKKSSSSKNRHGYNSCEKSDGIFVLELEEKKKSVYEQENDYDPYEHRVVEHPTNNAETMLHLVKGSLGTGILAMPRAFYHAGYAVGIIATIIIGLLCIYCMRILVRSEYELCKRKRVPSMTYPATAESALQEGPMFLRRFSKASIHIINTFLLIYQMGTCCVYLVFIARNLQSGLSPYFTMDLEKYMAILLLPLILVNYIRNLKFLAPFSTLANVIMLAGIAIILYYIFREPLSFEDRVAFGEVANFPLFFGTVLFALEAIGVIMPLENEMKTPKAYMKPCGVLNVSMGVIVAMYAGMGFFGYMRFGSEISGSITLNLGAYQEKLGDAVQILLAIAIFFTHPIQCYVAIDITWNEYISHYLEKYRFKMFWEYIIRTVIILLTFALAISIPELDLFISLFGAFCLSGLGLAFPAIIQLCAFWKVLGPTEKKILVAKNMCLVLIGTFGLVVGTFTSLREIIKKFS